MSMFTNAEYADMVFVYGFAEGNATQAVAEYARRYPNRRIPNKTVFTRIFATLRETGKVTRTRVRLKNVDDDNQDLPDVNQTVQTKPSQNFDSLHNKANELPKSAERLEENMQTTTSRQDDPLSKKVNEDLPVPDAVQALEETIQTASRQDDSLPKKVNEDLPKDSQTEQESTQPNTSRQDDLTKNVNEDPSKIPETAQETTQTSSRQDDSLSNLLYRNKINNIHEMPGPGDFPHRLEYCNWIMGNPEIYRDILFTDEAQFNFSTVFKSYKSHLWSQKNSRTESESQQTYVNVWCGLLEDQLIGPFVFDGNLTGEVYLQFLQEKLPSILEDMPLSKRTRLYFQHSGVPVYFTRAVTHFLDDYFPDHWIGRGGPRNWPARSPDLNPMDYIWNLIKHFVYKIKIETRKELIDRMNDTVRNIKMSRQVKFATRSTITCAAECIANNGDIFENVLPQFPPVGITVPVRKTDQYYQSVKRKKRPGSKKNSMKLKQNLQMGTVPFDYFQNGNVSSNYFQTQTTPESQLQTGTVPSTNNQTERAPVNQTERASVNLLQPGRFPMNHPQTGRFPINQSQAGRFPTNHPQAGRFPTNHPQAGRFPINHPQTERFPTNHPQAGRFPINHPQTGGVPIHLLQTGMNPANRLQTGSDTSNYFQTGTNPANQLQIGTVPFTNSQTERAPSNHLQSGRAPGSHLQTARVPDNHLHRQTGTGEVPPNHLQTAQSKSELIVVKPEAMDFREMRTGSNANGNVPNTYQVFLPESEMDVEEEDEEEEESPITIKEEPIVPAVKSEPDFDETSLELNDQHLDLKYEPGLITPKKEKHLDDDDDDFS